LDRSKAAGHEHLLMADSRRLYFTTREVARALLNEAA